MKYNAKFYMIPCTYDFETSELQSENCVFNFLILCAARFHQFLAFFASLFFDFDLEFPITVYDKWHKQNKNE